MALMMFGGNVFTKTFFETRLDVGTFEGLLPKRSAAVHLIHLHLETLTHGPLKEVPMLDTIFFGE